MSDRRQSPDKLLKRIQEEEKKELRGKLKIYLGAAPGVGKTHQMLYDALDERSKGLDVVIGVAESHGRREIESILTDFEIIPLQIIDYHGKKILEFDIDAALKRHPGLILIDEMAHTNAPGLRHLKRWQDIKELLDRGIDVYTTLNVQHIESLNDDVIQIINAPVKETIPDFMLDEADTIELIDIPPEALLKRLHEGKVYFPEQAEIAKEYFFRKGNLIALRELALRKTAEQVGEQVLLYRQGEGIKHIWPTKEKILVCVGPRAESLKLIRAARRIATNLQAEWIAVYVDTPHVQSSDIQRNNAIKNLRFAEQLGAETRILSGFDIVKEVMSFSRENNVTQIIVWKNVRTRWRDLFIRNLADEIVRHSGEIDVYIMTGVKDRKQTPENSPLKKSLDWKTYFTTIGIVALSTGINFLLEPFLSTSNLVMVYLLGIIVISLYGKMGPAILGSILSVLAYDFFFIPPFYSFAVSDIEYSFTLVVMLLVSYIISHLTILIRHQSETASLMERQTSALYGLSHRLANARGVDKLLNIGAEYVADIFDSKVMVLLPKNGQLEIRTPDKNNTQLDKKELGIAQWVYELGQEAGHGTDTLPFSDALFMPLLASKGTIGVLRIHPVLPQRLFSPEQMRLLESCVNQIASALEIDQLRDNETKSEFLTEADRIRNTLIQSISHNLRTPLVAILGSASTLIEVGETLEGQTIKKIGQDIYDETDQVNRLINNLMQISYLEMHEIKLQNKPCSLEEIINIAVSELGNHLGKRKIHINIPKNIPKIPVDNVLIQDVLVNLLDNAVKFTPAETPVEIFIEVTLENNKVVVSVEDHGSGIMLDETNQLFEKFYRGRMLTSERGLGLGLAICQKIIEAHGGKIWAENRKDGGAAFRFSLPIRV